ncbi:ankyrin repeat domain-containing protein 26-like [Rissa tridactyla]|uniref:ankyrin repeat domain-containing protein 26-like n=1 Tax=Rissa tridactyla TaxID=75485 RepID=UPI0023BA61D2|nr:ankyrin repeat domain-containing protein 26-like [Rissa tridactyla]
MVEFLLQKGPEVHAQDKHESIPNQLEEYVGCEGTGECSAGGTVGPAALHSPCSGTNADFPLGTPALTGTGVLPVAGAEQEEDFDSPSESKVLSLLQVSGLEREELQLKKDASTQSDCRGDRERWVRQLQQELANALKKSSLAEASLEAKKRYSRDLQEQKLQLQEELDRSKVKLQELKERHVRTECYAKSLKNAMKDKERELTASRILQSLLAASSGTAAISELEKRMQRLQVGKARLEAIARQQAKTIEALQKDLQASASTHNGLEDLITGFQATQTAQEHQYQQCGSESKEAKKLAKMKCRLEALLDEMQGRNIALEEERTRLKILLEGSWTTLMAYAGKKRESQLSFEGEVKNSCSEVANQVANPVSMAPHFRDLHRTGDAVKKTHGRQNQDLREKLSTLRVTQQEPRQNQALTSEIVGRLTCHR